MKGADLFMRDRASPSAPEVNITGEITQDNGDVRDVDVNFDGTKVIFSMRVIEDPDAEPLPTWNIWEYDTKTQVLRRIITSDTTAEEGHDIQPHYLPDGRIVFTSTRQRQARAILLDENKPQYAAQVEGSGGDPNPAFVLHVMKEDGSDIHQITFNQSHDLNPSVLNDGRIVYAHWEHAIDDDQYDLYAVNPDGTGVELLYGANSHATGTVNPATGNPSVIQFLNPRAMADGRTLALVRPFKTANQDIDGDGGDLVLIDTATYVDNTRAASPDNASLSGPAQARALPTDVRTIPGPSPGGRYRSAAPLFDGTDRLLVSWSQCRLMQEGRVVPCTSDRLTDTATPAVEAPPLYGVYI
jgi:Tol biopolymer transport system component